MCVFLPQNGRKSPAEEEQRTPADIIQSARQQYRGSRAIDRFPHQPTAAAGHGTDPFVTTRRGTVAY